MWMAEEIAARGGAVCFEEFMELALYHPVHGYYSSAMPRYGRSGDYLTAPTASPWYARTVARLASKLTGELGPLTVADVASGDGSFLAAFLEAMPGEWGAPGRVVSVESSPGLRPLQRERLGDSVEIAASLEEAGPPGGPVLIHASELYDALPVHRAVGRANGLQELWVVSASGSLQWEERPAGPEVQAYLERHGVELADGQVAEVNLRAEALHRALLAWAGPSSLVLVLDYGYPAARLYNPRGRRGGSLAVYSRHGVTRDPLAAPGRCDITAHVNWDDLRRPAREAGWTELGLWPLGVFLLQAGLPAVVEEAGLALDRELDAGVYAERQELKRILDPDGMGTDLRVLAQGRGPAGEAAAAALAAPPLPKTL